MNAGPPACLATICFHSFWKMHPTGCSRLHIKKRTSNHILGASCLLSFHQDLRTPSIIAILISTCEAFPLFSWSIQCFLVENRERAPAATLICIHEIVVYSLPLLSPGSSFSHLLLGNKTLTLCMNKEYFTFEDSACIRFLASASILFSEKAKRNPISELFLLNGLKVYDKMNRLNYETHLCWFPLRRKIDNGGVFLQETE